MEATSNEQESKVMFIVIAERLSNGIKMVFVHPTLVKTTSKVRVDNKWHGDISRAKGPVELLNRSNRECENCTDRW